MAALWVLPEDLGEMVDTEYATEAAQAASDILWALSGRKFTGVTKVTEQYVQDSSGWIQVPQGYIIEIPNDFFDVHHRYMVAEEATLRLRGFPVTNIEYVRTPDGVIVPATDYYVADSSTLVFRPGAVNSVQRLEISYTYGQMPPVMGQMAARMLAIEFAKAWVGDDSCALPTRVTSITRQGISFTILDSQDFLDDLRTGIYAVDLFLKSVNPDKARARAKVFSPDIPRARRVPGRVYTPPTTPTSSPTSGGGWTIVPSQEGN